MRRDEALRRMRENRESLAALGVTHAYLFGSVAADGATPESDIDVMVDLDEGPTGRTPLFTAFDVGGIQSELSEILGQPVDLVVRRDALQRGAASTGRCGKSAGRCLLSGRRKQCSP